MSDRFCRLAQSLFVLSVVLVDELGVPGLPPESWPTPCSEARGLKLLDLLLGHFVRIRERVRDRVELIAEPAASRTASVVRRGEPLADRVFH